MVAAALVTSCGGGSAPSHDEYVGAANRVCDRAGQRLEKLRKANAKEPDAARPERWIRARVVPAYADLSAELRDLAPPSNDATYLESLYDELDERILGLKARPSSGYDSVWSTPLKRRFANYGLTDCGTAQP